MRRELVLSAVALAAGLGAAALAAGSDRASHSAVAAAVVLVVGWAWIGSGLVAWRQRPANRLGPVMVFIGFAWFATALAEADTSIPFTIGTALQNLYLAGFVYLVLSFPSGRLEGALERGLLVAAVALTTAVEIAWLLFADSEAIICSDCPPNALQLVRADEVAEAIVQAQRAVGLALSVFTVALFARRWRRASEAQRRAVSPVVWTGAAMFVAIALSIVNDIAGEPLGQIPDWTRACVFAAVPVSVLAVLLRRRLDRGAVAGLVVELGSRPPGMELREALARALGDPSLELAYWLPAQRRYVSADGRLVRLPENDDERRVATIVERHGEPVAALLHDPAIRENAELVDSVCAAAALTLENERLRADLHAKVAELQASRARIVEATESERHRIERDLHDGTQQRLVSVAMALGLADAKLDGDRDAVGPVLQEARGTLALALEELRTLAQGIRPAILVERGLQSALDDLSRRAALPVRVDIAITGRLPEQVEAAAYFVASEALANAAKHSHAMEVRLAASLAGDVLAVEIADDGIGGAATGDGSGLRGLADRVEALGGRLLVSSPPGRGTTVRAELPCA